MKRFMGLLGVFLVCLLMGLYYLDCRQDITRLTAELATQQQFFAQNPEDVAPNTITADIGTRMADTQRQLQQAHRGANRSGSGLVSTGVVLLVLVVHALREARRNKNGT